MDTKNLGEQGFRPENIKALLEVKAREKADRTLNLISSKWALGDTMFIPDYRYDYEISPNLSPEEALSEFDQHVNPYPQTERPDDEIVDNLARKMLLEVYDSTFAPIYPYPLINPDWKEASIKNMYVRFSPLLPGKNKGFYIVQIIKKGEDKASIHERLAIATRPATLQILVSQL